MKFDTLLKIGTHAAKIVQHDSFQEMSKMIHRGVKRRLPDPNQMSGPQRPMHRGFGPIPPYGYRNNNHAIPPVPGSGQPNSGNQLPIKDLLTTENIDVVWQLFKGITKGNNNSK